MYYWFKIFLIYVIFSKVFSEGRKQRFAFVVSFVDNQDF